MTGKTKTEFVYDGRGSVAAELTYNTAWYTFGSALSRVNEIAKSYTPFGEPLTDTGSGYGYNAEYYNANTGSIYLRARNYAPALARFTQPDLLRGTTLDPGSLNRYLYVQNDPLNFVDPSGRTLGSFLKKAANKVVNTVKAVAADPVGAIRSAASTIRSAVRSAVADPVGTVKAAVTSAANVVRNVVDEIRRPNTSTSQQPSNNSVTQPQPPRTPVTTSGPYPTPIPTPAPSSVPGYVAPPSPGPSRGDIPAVQSPADEGVCGEYEATGAPILLQNTLHGLGNFLGDMFGATASATTERENAALTIDLGVVKYTNGERITRVFSERGTAGEAINAFYESHIDGAPSSAGINMVLFGVSINFNVGLADTGIGVSWVDKRGVTHEGKFFIDVTQVRFAAEASTTVEVENGILSTTYNQTSIGAMGLLSLVMAQYGSGFGLDGSLQPIPLPA